MKRVISISVLLFVVLTSQFAFSQGSSFELKRSIYLGDKDKDVKNITIDVSEKTSNMNVFITCKVVLGNLKIEIYDPKGKKQGEFSIESQYKHKTSPYVNANQDLNKEVIDGQIEKNISQPMPGQWIVKLIPEKVQASVEIRSRFLLQN